MPKHQKDTQTKIEVYLFNQQKRGIVRRQKNEDSITVIFLFRRHRVEGVQSESKDGRMRFH